MAQAADPAPQTPTPVPSRIKTIREQGDAAWSKRSMLESLWQEIANNFYVERADFTMQRFLGTDFAANLTTSFPLLVRRELGDTFSGMLRPNKQWFDMHTAREDQEDKASKDWLQMATRIQRRAMYDLPAQFVRSTKEADHDFAAFGQCAIRSLVNQKRQTLHYSTIHLRDIVWRENAEGEIDRIDRKWKLDAADVVKLFPDTAGPRLKKLATDKPYETVELRHVVLPADQYEAPVGQRWRLKYVSVFFDLHEMQVLEERPSWRLGYTIPRWVTVSGSQYAMSPATINALPDARLLQAMMLSLLEAGEKAANPPLIYVEQALRSDINAYAGGATAVDIEYDERLGEALRPLTQDMRGFPIGKEMNEDIRNGLKEAFYLNMLKPFTPTDDPEMTAFQAGQIVQDYIRKALPLFEPMEVSYNGALCVDTFGLLLRNGVFGAIQDAPQSIQRFVANGEMQFHFTSPLSQAMDADKGQKLVGAKGLIVQVEDLDPGAAAILDAKAALRDALEGIGTPSKWLRDPDQVAQLANAKTQAATVGQGLDLAGKGADASLKLAQAAAAARQAGLNPDAASAIAPVA